VSTELDYDRLINPCGLTDRGITSISKEIGRSVSVAEAKPMLEAALQSTFDIEFVRESSWQLTSI
jgi:lipoyl(octanoyl) transferase